MPKEKQSGRSTLKGVNFERNGASSNPIVATDGGLMTCSIFNFTLETINLGLKRG